MHTYCTCGYNTTYIVTYIYSTHKLQLQHVLLTSVSVYLTLKRHYCFAYTHTYIYASLIIYGVSTKCTNIYHNKHDTPFPEYITNHRV